MIVKNEEKYLARCLESAKHLVDEIVIVDTGSSDRTMEIARNYTEKVYTYPWAEDFAEARNYAIKQSCGRWIFSLDADETLQGDGSILRKVLENPAGKEAFFVPLNCQSNDTFAEDEHFIVLRLFRNEKEYQFHGKIHEQIFVKDQEKVGILDSPIIFHKSVSKSERKFKRNRNLRLLEQASKAAPDNIFLTYYQGVEWYGLHQFKKALGLFQKVRETLEVSYILFRALCIKYQIDCLKALGRQDEALCLCMDESLQYPTYCDLYFESGILLEQKQQYAAAIKWFEQAIAAGKPPAAFSHTQGTNSYLAFYHIGCCYEKMAICEKAFLFYEKALDENKDYYLPLYPLFFHCLRHKSAKQTFQWIEEHGYLDQPVGAQTLAKLFYGVGFPDLAANCLARWQSKSIELFQDYIHYLVYGGKPLSALTQLSQPQEQALSTNIKIDEIVALFLCGKSCIAKDQILQLWRVPTSRSAAWALFKLHRLLSQKASTINVENHRESEVISILLQIIDSCLRSQGENLDLLIEYQKLNQQCLKYLTNLSIDSAVQTAKFLQAKSNELTALAKLKLGTIQIDNERSM